MDNFILQVKCFFQKGYDCFGKYHKDIQTGLTADRQKGEQGKLKSHTAVSQVASPTNVWNQTNQYNFSLPIDQLLKIWRDVRPFSR